MTALPVHCPSITSIQGPSVLSSEKKTIIFWKHFSLFYRKSNIWSLPILQLFVVQRVSCGQSSSVLFLLPLRTYTISHCWGTFLWKHTLQEKHKNISGHTQYPSAQEEYNNIFMETLTLNFAGKTHKNISGHTQYPAAQEPHKHISPKIIHWGFARNSRHKNPHELQHIPLKTP